MGSVPNCSIYRPALGGLSSCNQPQRSFDDETLDWISRYCPHWRRWKDNDVGVGDTYIIPDTFSDLSIDCADRQRGEKTEKHVYDILKEFGEKTDQPMFVVHSYKFHERFQSFVKGGKETGPRWVSGEHDFVIVHRKFGVIFFQVKARAKTASAYNKALEQLKTDKQSLINVLEQLSSDDDKGIKKEMKEFPGFVVMPNCSRTVAGKRRGCFQEDIETVDAFKKWCEDNIKSCRSTVFTTRMYEQMAIRFVGPTVTTCPLKVPLNDTHNRLIQLTEKQLTIMLGDVPQQNIMGPAGSGKTCLLLKKATEVADKLKEGDRILIMCYNRPLSFYLKSQFANEYLEKGSVVVKTFVSLLLEIEDGNSFWEPPADEEGKKQLVVDCVKKLKYPGPDRTHKYEHVFVDEGQDMYGEWMELVDLLHADSDKERRYKWVFFDNNQIVHIMGPNDRNITSQITSKAKEMNEIIRNTFNIFECSKKFLSPSVNAKMAHGVPGLQVEWIIGPSAKSQSAFLEQGAIDLVKTKIRSLATDSVKMSDIVVLIRDNNYHRRKKLCQDLSKVEPNILVQDAEQAIESPNPSAITVDSIRRFKGLEREVVILLDPPRIDENTKSLYYVAMSRCFCLLIIVTSKENKQLYDDFKRT